MGSLILMLFLSLLYVINDLFVLFVKYNYYEVKVLSGIGLEVQSGGVEFLVCFSLIFSPSRTEAETGLGLGGVRGSGGVDTAA